MPAVVALAATLATSRSIRLSAVPMPRPASRRSWAATTSERISPLSVIEPVVALIVTLPVVVTPVSAMLVAAARRMLPAPALTVEAAVKVMLAALETSSTVPLVAIEPARLNWPEDDRLMLPVVELSAVLRLNAPAATEAVDWP